jgi:FkbM family methyltransferase
MEKLNISKLHDDCILDALPGTSYVHGIKHVFVIGGHRFQEYNKLKSMFPDGCIFYVFEPVSFLFEELKSIYESYADVKLFKKAIGDFIGKTSFNISDNDAASSSILQMKEHLNLFKHVKYCRTEEVDVITIDQAILEIGIIPDVLFMDVQGMEYKILTSIDSKYFEKIKLIYTEVSLIEVYENAMMLSDIKLYLLKFNFEFIFFTPLANSGEVHGNALFANKSIYN